MWADPGGTAIPGQPAAEVEQAPKHYHHKMKVYSQCKLHTTAEMPAEIDPG
ncbi:hypothetical protein CpipJ_CPIJ013081 [Culex quinquefasciatus]|uniref:Uncharacterized protein n=1 Tax=Culex quinquefasciatus TaxID=7176 RepID=B0X161_CULQU|nr:hypothetical protein CpipJ_CPIJ013081 [Culex quinquefasciatus]|eukprot:XP_001863383.1 hypothetical protein CpipJ_CPIJ013081 [Culex quinquefasciatus]